MFPSKCIFKKVSSSKSYKKTQSLREFKKIPPNIFIYESILIKIHMNVNIINTLIIFHFIKYAFDGHIRSQKVTFMFF